MIIISTLLYIPTLLEQYKMFDIPNLIKLGVLAVRARESLTRHLLHVHVIS